jgi:Carboxypeptidase regulatory-like domain
MSISKACCLFLLLFGQCAYLFSQAIYGSITGTVTDSSGGVIPNATVTVTDIDKGTSQTVQTNQDGNYTVQHLIPDAYKINVKSAGLSGVDIPNIVVSADTSARVDVQLRVGASSQTVEVSGETPQLTVDRADVANVLNTKSLEDLPNRRTGSLRFRPASYWMGRTTRTPSWVWWSSTRLLIPFLR